MSILTPENLTSLGLILNILGVLLLFFFGFPQPNHDEGVSVGFSENTTFTDGTSVKSILEKARKRKRLYLAFSYVALAFLLAGFILQFAAIYR